jgi:hypothetical protein
MEENIAAQHAILFGYAVIALIAIAGIIFGIIHYPPPKKNDKELE